MPKELKAILKVIGVPFTATAIILCLVAIPFIKISKLMGHTYWKW